MPENVLLKTYAFKFSEVLIRTQKMFPEKGTGKILYKL
jgi:hypothetical protein